MLLIEDLKTYHQIHSHKAVKVLLDTPEKFVCEESRKSPSPSKYIAMRNPGHKIVITGDFREVKTADICSRKKCS